MDWQDLTVAIISFVGGGGLLGLLTLRQSKESKQIDNAAALVKEYRELLDSYKADADEAQKEVEALRNEINDMKVQMSAMKEKMAMYQVMLQSASILKCERINCQQRKPPINKEELESIVGERVKSAEYED